MPVLLSTLIPLSLGACRQQADRSVPPATETELAAADQLDRGELSDGVAVPHFDDDGYYEMREVLFMTGDGDAEPYQVEVDLWVDPTLASACGMDDPKVNFATDSARVGKSTALEQLAACLNREPLAGDPVQITGYTDPRGAEEYNRELGLDRADAVASVLRNGGVSDDRIDTYSLGEEQASSNPDEWSENRKVVIRLDR